MLYTKQHTIKNPVYLEGRGIHFGEKVKICLQSAPEYHGIKFRRVDIQSKPIIEALLCNVMTSRRNTALRKYGIEIHTIEHILSALAGTQIDNILIDIDSIELPAMDGSAIDFVKAINKAGIEEQKAEREFITIKESLSYTDNETRLDAFCIEDYKLDVVVDYKRPALSNQHAQLNNIKEFSSAIAAARTFCFAHEIKNLIQKGLIKGGDLDNSLILFDGNSDKKEFLKILSSKKSATEKDLELYTKLRYDNEPAKHKLLDLMGDLLLLGKPLKAQIIARKPGHAHNISFAKKIKDSIERNRILEAPTTSSLLTTKEIQDMLPHDYPFRMIDKIVHIDEDSIIGIKNVTINEPCFQGHFPNNPIMPGVLELESMAQTGGILALIKQEDPTNYWTYLLRIENCRFRKTVVPGDTIVTKCNLLTTIRKGVAKMRCVAYVLESVACEADLSARIVKRK